MKTSVETYSVICQLFLASGYSVIKSGMTRKEAEKELNKHGGDIYTTFEIKPDSEVKKYKDSIYDEVEEEAKAEKLNKFYSEYEEI